MEAIDTRTAFKKFMPECAVFVISTGSRGENSGMIAGFNMKCSTEPFMLGVSLWKEGYTHTLIQESGEFVVAVPNKKLEEALLYFGSHHGNEIKKFQQTGVRTRMGAKVGCLLLEDATINFECKLVEQVDVGDHILFIGEVVASHINDDEKVLLNFGRDENGERLFHEL